MVLKHRRHLAEASMLSIETVLGEKVRWDMIATGCANFRCGIWGQADQSIHSN